MYLKKRKSLPSFSAKKLKSWFEKNFFLVTTSQTGLAATNSMLVCK